VNVSHLAGNQSETAIDINPVNPNNLVAVSNNIAGITNIFTAFSMDAGVTWTTVNVGHANDQLGAALGRCDPAVAFDDFGNVHLVYLTGCGDGDQTNNTVVVMTSTDGGQTYPFANRRIVFGPGGLDKPWIAAGPDAVNPNQQAVWVTFRDAAGRIAIAGAAVPGVGDPSSPLKKPS
jgi:hypothetical protein